MTNATTRLMDTRSVADRLGTSVRHVRRLVLEKRIPYLKVGHFVRFDPDEIEKWLDQSRVESESSVSATS